MYNNYHMRKFANDSLINTKYINWVGLLAAHKSIQGILATIKFVWLFFKGECYVKQSSETYINLHIRSTIKSRTEKFEILLERFIFFFAFCFNGKFHFSGMCLGILWWAFWILHDGNNDNNRKNETATWCAGWKRQEEEEEAAEDEQLQQHERRPHDT